MRMTALAGFFAFAMVIVAANSSPVSAEALDLLKVNSKDQTVAKVSVLAAIDVSSTKPAAETPPPKPEPTVHEVKADETLSSIAEQHQTTWIRLFNKNEQLAHPDVINVGDKVTIPLPDEQLKERALPEPPAPQPAAPQTAPAQTPTATRRTGTAAATTSARGSSAGNTYTPGYCTWYAKNMRPDLPNNLGNADTWVARAAAQGIPTGSAPRVGAIGQQGMHVVYVQSVNGNGTVTISEMNYQGLYIISTRTVPASSFMYIY